MNFWDRFFLGADEVERGAAADKQLAELNRKAYEAGRWDASQYQAAEDNRLQQSADTYGSQIQDEFVSGAKEGLERAQDAVKGAVGTVTTGALGFVPWYVWVLAAVWLAAQIGFLKIPNRR